MELTSGVTAASQEWSQFHNRIIAIKPDILITNEMPFGPWLAVEPQYNADRVAESISEAKEGLKALRELEVSVILSSRPVIAGGKLANEAFALISGQYQAVHHKQYFPDEPGYYEANWFVADNPGFDVVEAGGIKTGFLLCTELFFTEWARHYRRLGASLIAVPRASGVSVEKWHAAAKMAAIVSGCYVASSNRVGPGGPDLQFGGRGFCFAPDGSLIAETSPDQPVVVFELNEDQVKSQQQEYPCYVSELGPM